MYAIWFHLIIDSTCIVNYILYIFKFDLQKSWHTYYKQTNIIHLNNHIFHDTFVFFSKDGQFIYFICRKFVIFIQVLLRFLSLTIARYGDRGFPS